MRPLMRRRRQRTSGTVPGRRSRLLAIALFAVVVLGPWGLFLTVLGRSFADDLHLRAAGVRASAVALHNRTEEVTGFSGENGPETYVSHHTTVRIQDGGEMAREVEIDGKLPTGDRVQLVYLPGHPESARLSSDVGTGHLVWVVVGDVFLLVIAVPFLAALGLVIAAFAELLFGFVRTRFGDPGR
jgi:hypothetical protein